MMSVKRNVQKRKDAVSSEAEITEEARGKDDAENGTAVCDPISHYWNGMEWNGGSLGKSPRSMGGYR